MINPLKKSKPAPKLMGGLLRLVILISLSTPLGFALYKQWKSVEASLTSINWSNVAIGSVVQLAGLPLMGVISWVVLRHLNTNRPLHKVTGIYFISQVAKYLPGGIWAFPGRAVAYQAIGVEKVTSVLSVIRELIVLFLGAALIGLLGLIQGLPISDWINFTTLFGILVCILLVILTQLPGFWKVLKGLKLLKKVNLTFFESGQSQLDLRWLGYALIVSLLYWIITGIGFYYITLAVTSNGASLTWLQSASIFSLAWCAGFVIVLAPAGIGIRESAIAFLLSQTMTIGEALSVAIVARLWWTVTEAIYVLISLVWLSGKANRFILTKVKSLQHNPETNEANDPA